VYQWILARIAFFLLSKLRNKRIPTLLGSLSLTTCDLMLNQSFAVDASSGICGVYEVPFRYGLLYTHLLLFHRSKEKG